MGDEQSEALLWTSWEGCLDDVILLLSSGVEVNSRGQVRPALINDPYINFYLTEYVHHEPFSLTMLLPAMSLGDRFCMSRKCGTGGAG